MTQEEFSGIMEILEIQSQTINIMLDRIQNLYNINEQLEYKLERLHARIDSIQGIEHDE
jgi:glycerol-3-phosphate responsive antiterminator